MVSSRPATVRRSCVRALGVQAVQLQSECVPTREGLRGNGQLSGRLRVCSAGAQQCEPALDGGLRDQEGQHSQADLVGPVQILQDDQQRPDGSPVEDRP